MLRGQGTDCDFCKVVRMYRLAQAPGLTRYGDPAMLPDPASKTADIAIQAATVDQGRAQAKQGQTGLFTTGFQLCFSAENAFNLFIFGTVR